MAADPAKPVRRGRGARKAVRMTRDIAMLPALKRKLPLTEPMDGDQIARIDAASMSILENVGVVFRDEIALADWRRAGAKVDGETVFLDRGMVRDLIATIPETFIYHARNPVNNLPFGGDYSMFVPMTGAPYLRDLDDVRRNPTLADLADFHKLSHMSPAIHSSAHHIVEPYDHPISQRHLRITYSSMKHSDKTFMGMTTSPKNAEDVMEMCAILFGEDYLEDHPVCTGNCNGNSPLVWDETMLGAMRAFCRRNQPVLCSPFVLGGGQHACIGRADCGAVECRGAERAGLYTGRPQGLPGDLRPLPVDRQHEIWRANGGHARDQPDEFHDRPDGALLWRALAYVEHAWRGKNL